MSKYSYLQEVTITWNTFCISSLLIPREVLGPQILETIDGGVFFSPSKWASFLINSALLSSLLNYYYSSPVFRALLLVLVTSVPHFRWSENTKDGNLHCVSSHFGSFFPPSPTLLQASLGTTKYCSYFLKNMQCPKPDCMYLHELGDEAASFTKEEMQVVN